MVHLDIDVDHRNGYVVLAPHGEVDYATGPALREKLTDVMLSGAVNVVVDLAEVDFMESTGLGVLIGGRRRALALDGSLSLARPQEHVLKVFTITGLDRVFRVFDSVEEATASPASHAAAGWPSPETARQGPL